MAGDCVATAVSVSGQLTHSSPSHPTSNASGWQDILTGSTEFCTLAGESVSDLLAEVEAMESLSGLATPTSIMNCGGEFTEGSKMRVSVLWRDLAPEPGKGDALSSSGDLRVPMVTDEPLGNAREMLLICKKDVVCILPQALKQRETENRVRKHRNQLGSSPGKCKHGLGRIEQGGANTGWGGGQGIAQGNTSIHPGTPAGAMLESQLRYGGDRFIGPRDRGFQNRDVGFGRGRFQWNRQTYGNGGGSFRPSPKGQRVCKYYESGYCKKGASCGYLHP
ncbi:hypothetical protein GBA52_028695 [Prunus armeniaca]|nr:hypothetical protein GBA52_028695 [Prunus armeniaca]